MKHFGGTKGAGDDDEDKDKFGIAAGLSAGLGNREREMERIRGGAHPVQFDIPNPSLPQDFFQPNNYLQRGRQKMQPDYLFGG